MDKFTEALENNTSDYNYIIELSGLLMLTGNDKNSMNMICDSLKKYYNDIKYNHILNTIQPLYIKYCNDFSTLIIYSNGDHDVYQSCFESSNNFVVYSGRYDLDYGIIDKYKRNTNSKCLRIYVCENSITSCNLALNKYEEYTYNGSPSINKWINFSQDNSSFSIILILSVIFSIIISCIVYNFIYKNKKTTK